MNDRDKAMQALGELTESLNSQLFFSALSGCGLRELYILGEENRANKLCRFGEKEAKLKMELASFIEEKVRTGLSISKALDSARAAGYINKLSEFLE